MPPNGKKGRTSVVAEGGLDADAGAGAGADADADADFDADFDADGELDCVVSTSLRPKLSEGSHDTESTPSSSGS